MLRTLIQTLTAIRRLFAPTLFEIEIQGDTLRVRHGEAPGGIVSEFADAARDLEIRRGTIRGVRTGHGVTLAFSREIPAEAHQRFRNILALYRDRIRGPNG
jgi:hypothetical protein